MLSTLRILADLPADHLTNLLSSASRFIRQFPSDMMPANAVLPDVLLNKLDLYGIWVATQFIGKCKSAERSLSAEALAAEFLRRSGLLELETALKQHFGTRSFLIKWNSARWSLQRVAFRLRERGSEACRPAAATILKRIEESDIEEYLLKEMKVLSDLYDGRLEISAEEQLVIRNILGENGLEPYERLGFPQPVDQGTLLDGARMLLSYWQICSVDPRPRSTETRAAESVMVRALERLEVRVRDSRV
jgi:hypothetical protein